MSDSEFTAALEDRLGSMLLPPVVVSRLRARPVTAGLLLGALYLAEVALWLRALGMTHAAPVLLFAVVVALAGTSAAAGGRVGGWTARLSSPS